MRVMRLRIGTVWRAAMRGGYRFRDVPGGLEQQRRFADAGFAGDEHHRTRHYAAAEYTVELAEASGESVHRVGGDARDRLRRALHIRHRDGRARGAARTPACVPRLPPEPHGIPRWCPIGRIPGIGHTICRRSSHIRCTHSSRFSSPCHSLSPANTVSDSIQQA